VGFVTNLREYAAARRKAERAARKLERATRKAARLEWVERHRAQFVRLARRAARMMYE
jgi:hypothetical protein